MNLETLNVQEMSLKEINSTDGGVLLVIGVMLWYNLTHDTSGDFLDGFNDGSGANCM